MKLGLQQEIECLEKDITELKQLQVKAISKKDILRELKIRRKIMELQGMLGEAQYEYFGYIPMSDIRKQNLISDINTMVAL